MWTDLKTDVIDVPTAIARLLSAREAGAKLSARSLDLLLLQESPLAAQLEYVNDVKNVQYSQQTLITCMDTLKKDSEEEDAISLLVVGTESGRVYILPQDPSNTNVLCEVRLPSSSAVPVLFSTSGFFDVEWRVVVACRDGNLYTIKGGDVRGTAVLTGTVIGTGSQVVAMAKQEKFLWVATMDRLVSCYSFKGKRTASILCTEDIVDIHCLAVKRSKTNYLLLVALSTGEIRMYKEAKVLHSFMVEKPIMGMKFGTYGREENSLVIAHGAGSLTFKILKRLADFDGPSSSGGAGPVGAPPEQEIPLAVPKKTKLYVEQTQREREFAADIHRVFQKDLCRLRLETARAYVKTLTDSQLVVRTTPRVGSVRITADPVPGRPAGVPLVRSLVPVAIPWVRAAHSPQSIRWGLL